MAFASLTVYVITMLIRPHEWGALINEPSTIVRNSLLLCLVLFIFQQNKNLTLPHFPLMVMLLLMVFISVAATGWIGGSIIQGDLFFRTAFVPFLLISGIVDTLRKQQILLVVVVVASLLMVLNGHVQVTNEFGIGLVGNLPNVTAGEFRITFLGFLSDPNDLGMFLLMSIPVFFYFKEKMIVILRPIFWCGIGAVLYGIFLTNSRGTLLGLIALVLFWCWRNFGNTKTLLLGLALSPAGLFLFSSFRTISAEDASSQGRLEAWYSGLQMLLSNPLFGVGHGNFMEHHTRTAHNSFVLAFSELGLVGCLVWVAILVVTTVSLLNISNKKYLLRYGPLSDAYLTTANQESKLAQTMVYSFLAYFVTGFFLSRTYVPTLYFYLGMSAACLGRVLRAYPMIDIESICSSKLVVRATLATAFGGIITIYLIGKLFL